MLIWAGLAEVTLDRVLLVAHRDGATVNEIEAMLPSGLTTWALSKILIGVFKALVELFESSTVASLRLLSGLWFLLD